MVASTWSLIVRWFARVLGWLSPSTAAGEAPREPKAPVSSENVPIAGLPAPRQFHLAARLRSAAKLNPPKSRAHKKKPRIVGRNRPVVDVIVVKRQRRESRQVLLRTPNLDRPSPQPTATVISLRVASRPEQTAPAIKRAA
jgi:hypothetical protein